MKLNPRIPGTRFCRNAALACFLAGLGAVPLVAQNQDWEKPQLTGVNNELPHATMVICPDAQTARKIGVVSNAERVKSPFYRSLNGAWKYHYSANPVARVPDFWRPPNDNDRGRDGGRSQIFWRPAHQGAELRSFNAVDQGDGVAVTVSLALPKAAAAEWTTTYQINGLGEIAVSAQFKPGKTNLVKLPRLGMQLALAPGFADLTWFGVGPQETYCDRKDARVGVYSGSVAEQFCADYVKPGESGNKVDVRWVALTNAKGAGLLAAGQPLLSVNAQRHTTEDLQQALHPFQLPPRDFVTLNLDLKQQGVGGDDSWGAWPHDADTIPCREYNYSFRLSPFASAKDQARLLAR